VWLSAENIRRKFGSSVCPALITASAAARASEYRAVPV
jgi:hypothetical protein